MFLTRQLKVKFTGSEEYRPKDLPRDKAIPVVGFHSKQIRKTFDGEERLDTELIYLVIDSKGKVVPVVAFNCIAIIDDNTSPTNAGTHKLVEALAITAETMQKAAVILKVLQEKIAQFPDVEGQQVLDLKAGRIGRSRNDSPISSTLPGEPLPDEPLPDEPLPM